MRHTNADPEDPLAEVWAESAGVPLPGSRAGSSAPSRAMAGAVDSLPAALPLTGNIWRTEELLDRGISAREVRRLSDGGGLFKVRRGCYVRNSFWAALDQDGISRTRIDAYAHRTLTSSTGSYVFSHTSAARLHRRYLWQVDDTIHIAVPFLPSSGGMRATSQPTRACFPPSTWFSWKATASRPWNAR